MKPKKGARECLGYGIYERNCTNKAGTPWTKLWCLRCDEIRRAKLRRQLEDLTKEQEVREVKK